MMYTRGFTRGPSKLVTQRRTGPTQQIENKTNDLKLTSWLSSNSSAPKIVFNRPNGKGYHTVAIQKEEPPSEGFTPAHEENVRFVYEAWQEVEQRLAGDGRVGDEPCGQAPVQYTEKTSSTTMKNFVPIDLEEWWAQRFLANINNLS
ncbi:MAPK regulated corepressor interacting protein 2 isoform X2 [Esox lucius]|uniref:Uncharacterized protein n=1 Tax=Esox lucius TaxID=8010 RepID=A0AAY5KFL6_ESOLU|nr:MAPK regulated corepressor interacting protein 2 isoform X2 [Esox lucius]